MSDAAGPSAKPDDRAEQRAKEEARLQEQLGKIRYRIFVLSGKGGVGKSTVASNIAVELALEEKRVGLLDVDLHGPNIPKMLGIDHEQLGSNMDRKLVPVQPEYLPRLKVASMAFMLEDENTPVIWRGPLKHGVIRQLVGEVEWGELDYLVVDSPPGTGDEPLSVAQTLGTIDLAVIVTTPQDVALLDARKSINFAKTVGLEHIAVIENMSGLICPHCGQEIKLFGSGGGEALAKEFGVEYLGAIPLDPLAVAAGDGGLPVVVNGELKDHPIVAAFRQAVAKLRDLVEG